MPLLIGEPPVCIRQAVFRGEQSRLPVMNAEHLAADITTDIGHPYGTFGVLHHHARSPVRQVHFQMECRRRLSRVQANHDLPFHRDPEPAAPVG
jgi:hypothetical protein